MEKATFKMGKMYLLRSPVKRGSQKETHRSFQPRNVPQPQVLRPQRAPNPQTRRAAALASPLGIRSEGIFAQSLSPNSDVPGIGLPCALHFGPETYSFILSVGLPLGWLDAVFMCAIACLDRAGLSIGAFVHVCLPAHGLASHG